MPRTGRPFPSLGFTTDRNKHRHPALRGFLRFFGLPLGLSFSFSLLDTTDMTQKTSDTTYRDTGTGTRRLLDTTHRYTTDTTRKSHFIRRETNKCSFLLRQFSVFFCFLFFFLFFFLSVLACTTFIPNDYFLCRGSRFKQIHSYPQERLVPPIQYTLFHTHCLCSPMIPGMKMMTSERYMALLLFSYLYLGSRFLGFLHYLAVSDFGNFSPTSMGLIGLSHISHTIQPMVSSFPWPDICH